VRTVGIGLHWQEFVVGDQFRTVGRTITEADITAFVGVTGMTEVLFTNLEYLRTESAIPGRPAPGALVYAIAEGLLLQGCMQVTGLAFLHTEINVERAVVAGDTIHVECEVTESRAASRGNRGLVRTRNRVVNQKGETVMTYTPLRLIKGK